LLLIDPAAAAAAAAAGALKRKSHLAIKSQLHPDVQQKLNQLTTAGVRCCCKLHKTCAVAMLLHSHLEVLELVQLQQEHHQLTTAF
jgi:hypothetical protein